MTIYLDNAATSYPKPEAVGQAMQECLLEYGANPGRGSHSLAMKANRAIFKVREEITNFFNINDSSNFVFTLNATDALNLAIKGFLKSGDTVITTSMEHNSVTRPLTAVGKEGVQVIKIECSKQGYVDPDDIEKALREGPQLLIINHASNVTGSLQPLEEITKLCHDYGVPVLADASQTAGVYQIDLSKMELDMMAFPGHKGLLGPQGTGGLYISPSIELRELRQGGTGSDSEQVSQPKIRPDRYEAGTQNTVGIVGLGAGIDFINSVGIDKIRKKEISLTKKFIEELKEIKEVKIYGPMGDQPRVAVVSINVNDLGSNQVAFILDQAFDVAVRSGLHCAPWAHQTIDTLEQGTVRFSFGYFNTEEDIELAIKALRQIIKENL